MTCPEADDRAPGVGGATLGVARARARESAAERPLFTDPYARIFVEAVGQPGSGADPENHRSVANYAAARTKWFDDFFLSSSATGLSQVVILAAGLDARAWRLPWLRDTVIYELDQPKVLAFKTATLSTSGARPAADYVPVAVDLGGDWPKTLTAAGFDHTEPTAWAAEGLLPHLTARERDRLFDRVTLYSARGSRIGVDASGAGGVAAALCGHGWEANSVDAADILQRYHRAPAVPDDPLGLSVLIDAHLV
ncbi:MAG: SAM-dependent methyltransferase [Actinomycetota bacterium]|nr:SAM-dependent methyltransferase [Actinomycetota bacterium]